MKSKFRFLSRMSRLRKDKRTSGPRLLARLLRDEEGAYLLVMAVAIPIFIGIAALATEGAWLFHNHRNVQSAADAAAYSAAISYSTDGSLDNATTQAQAIVASYGFVVGTGNDQVSVPRPQVIANYEGTPYTAIQVTATRPQSPLLSSIWVSSPFNVSATATAIISGGAGGGNGNCMLGLAPTGTAIQLLGNSGITAPGCGVFSNSNGSCSGRGVNFTPSIDLGGNGSITGGAVGAAGCVSVTGSSNIGPPPNGYTGATPTCPTCADNPVINPYTNLTPPTAGTCLPANTGVVNGGTTTLNPGTYCTGGISVTNGATVTLNPGTYILNGPVQLFVKNSTLTGNGVTLVFTDTGNPSSPYPPVPGSGNAPTAMSFSSLSTVNLRAPAADATLGVPGMLIIGNTNIPLDTLFSIAANGVGSGMQGVIYLPTGDFSWQGTPIIAGGCTQMIAYRMFMQGNAVFDNSNCDLSGGGAGGGVKPIGNVVTLVK